tara:strand:- start:1077 stop:1268 length:192 start_codon:yes stop_codon:yes gene_type:complete
MNRELDVNILVNHYHKKLSELINQNVLMEAKIASMTKDYMDLEEQFLKLQNGETEDNEDGFEE